jgi:hypothetical protein
VGLPNIFIVGAPRCGTSSLYAYLSAHPGVFVPSVKEPHYFGSDLAIRQRPAPDLERYLALFADAGARQSVDASVFYLYSRTAPAEILALSPSARILVLLRPAAEMIESHHAHNLLLGQEDILDLEEALAAEEDRVNGRRIPPRCTAPVTLRYSFLARFTDHVVRYREAFGAEGVKCVLLDDLRRNPERTYAEVLAFLGLEPAGGVDFRVHNERRRWRAPRLSRGVVRTIRAGQRVGEALPSRRARELATLTARVALALWAQVAVAPAPPAPRRRPLPAALARSLGEDARRLGAVLRLDLSGWAPPT